MSIGIGRPLAGSPSLTTVRTDRVYGGSAGKVVEALPVLPKLGFGDRMYRILTSIRTRCGKTSRYLPLPFIADFRPLYRSGLRCRLYGLAYQFLRLSALECLTSLA